MALPTVKQDPEFYNNNRKAAVNSTFAFHVNSLVHELRPQDLTIVLDAAYANSSRHLKHIGINPDQILAVSCTEAEEIRQHHYNVSSDYLFDVLADVEPDTLTAIFADYCGKYTTDAETDLTFAFSQKLFRRRGSVLGITSTFRDNTRDRVAMNDLVMNSITELAEANGYRARPLPGGQSYNSVFTHFYLIEHESQPKAKRPEAYALPGHFDSQTLFATCTPRHQDALAYIATGATTEQLLILKCPVAHRVFARWKRRGDALGNLPKSWWPILPIIVREELARLGIPIPNTAAELKRAAQPLYRVLDNPDALAQFLSDRLTPDALTILVSSAHGLSPIVIGNALGRSPNSISGSLANAYNNLGVPLLDRHGLEPFIRSTSHETV